uniref:Probable serine/threonine-protein kinase DDB_G0279405 n=1 Tax=Sinocyclocheilus rhinocerous TaxID=307959 RepID=A0A673IGF8_9TELE
MGSNQSVLKDKGYTLVSEQDNKILVKNKGGDLFVIKKLNGNVSQFLQKLNHPHIVLDWAVKLCMALKHLHDQQILHKNLQSTDAQTAETEALSYVAPEILRGEPYDEKSEIWSLGCIIYEMCMLKCAFAGKNTVDIIPKILRSSYKALPETFSQDLRQLVRDTLQTDPANRPSVSEILMRPFIIKHLYEKSTQTIKELNVLKVLEELADGLERVHYNTTVSSLTGGVIGLAGGITSIVGLILTPFTFGASLIVTGVGIGVAVAGGVTAGASNITKMVNQNSNRQKIKMLITELQEKITSTSCCIQNIQIAVEMQQRDISKSNQSWSNAQSGADVWASAGLVRLTEVASVGKVAAQAARTVRVAEAATGVLSTLFVAVDIFFIALDSREIHKLRRDHASIATQQESTDTESKSSQTPDSESEHNDTQNQPSPNNNEQELRSENMKFVKKIRVTVEELNKHLNELKQELEVLRTKIPNTNN